MDQGPLIVGTRKHQEGCILEAKDVLFVVGIDDQGLSEEPGSNEHPTMFPKMMIVNKGFLARYCSLAREQLSSGLHICHVFHLLVRCTTFVLAYYDRSGPVYSKGVRFDEDLHKGDGYGTFDIWKYLKREDREDAEHDRFVLKGESHRQLWKISAQGKHGLTIRIGDRLAPYVSPGPIGRCSMMWRALVVAHDEENCLGYPQRDQGIVMKASWPSKSRATERNVIGICRASFHQLDGVKQSFRGQGRLMGRLEDAIPMCYGEMRFDRLENDGLSIGINDTQKEKSPEEKWTGSSSDFVSDFNLRKRGRRVMNFEVLHPLLQLDTIENFKRCRREIFQGSSWIISNLKLLKPFAALHRLWKSGHQHRDINPSNFKFRELPNGDVQGVLYDWDLSVRASHNVVIPRAARTGTDLFVAFDKLETTFKRRLK